MSAVVAGVLVNASDTQDVLEASASSTGPCCGGKKEDPVSQASLGQKLMTAVQYGYGRMISDTAKWLVIGLVAATVITAVVPQSFFLQWGDGVVAMLVLVMVMVLVGLPMYICATASTPVAAGLLFAGVSPGAALVFMLTGPATNIATMGVIREQLGGRALTAYLVGVIGTAIVCGLALNEFYQAFGWSLQITMQAHGESYALWQQLTAILLSVLVLRVWVQPLLQRKPKLAEALPD